MPENSEHLANFVTDHVNAMLAYWDKDLVCRFANKAYLDWFGKSKEEMVNKITIQQLLGPLFNKNLPYIDAALKGEIQTFEREIPIPDGSIRYSLANYFPHVENGEVKGFVAHVADITQVKLLERDLIQSNQIIKSQNDTLLTFANTIAHNLKSYSNNLESVLNFFSETQSEIEKQELFEYLKQISQGFNATISNLSDIVKIHNGNNTTQSIKISDIDIGSQIQNVLNGLNINILDNNVIVTKNIENNLFVKGNAAYLESVLYNLVSNAIKYKNPDKIPSIEISAIEKDGQVLLTVKDNGLGIDLEKYGDKLFGLYQTFHHNNDATGLGLYITKLQIDAMAGTIDVNSEINKGSEFIVTLKKSEVSNHR